MTRRVLYSRHARQRMILRGSSEREVNEAIRKGTKRTQDGKIVASYMYFEVHVRGHDLAVLRSLGPFSDRFIDLTFRAAAENHPLPRMAAIEDAPRHSLQIIRVLLKVTHRMGAGDMMQSSSQASPHNS